MWVTLLSPRETVLLRPLSIIQETLDIATGPRTHGHSPPKRSPHSHFYYFMHLTDSEQLTWDERKKEQ